MSITSRENMMRKSWEDLLRKNDFKTHLNDEKLRKSVCKLSQVSDLVFKTEQMQEVTFSLFLSTLSTPPPPPPPLSHGVPPLLIFCLGCMGRHQIFLVSPSLFSFFRLFLSFFVLSPPSHAHSTQNMIEVMSLPSPNYIVEFTKTIQGYGSMEPIPNSSEPPTLELKELQSTENGEVSEVYSFFLFFCVLLRTHPTPIRSRTVPRDSNI